MMIDLSLTTRIVDLLANPARTFGNDIHLAADNGLYPLGFRRFLELISSEHNPMIGQGDSRHLEFLRLLDEVLHTTSRIEQRVVGVVMEMYKIGLGHGSTREKSKAKQT